MMRLEDNARANALKITDREDIIKAYREQKKGKFLSNADNMRLLINTLNECAGRQMMDEGSYRSCGDCKRWVLKFWENIIKEWAKD